VVKLSIAKVAIVVMVLQVVRACGNIFRRRILVFGCRDSDGAACGESPTFQLQVYTQLMLLVII
jgi:hypothetical protein